jgi:3-phenylpropionate/trans-cinnamate dioxygenase ferredoxin reductase subunit
MPRQTVLIIGASLAGASAAAALRKHGFEGRIVLVGEEAEPPYERPELSKKYLRGEVDTPVLVHDEVFYAGAGIELLTGVHAQRLDVHRREVLTTDGTLRFDRLLLATGASPRRLEVPGADLDGVVTLRTRRDADTIRSRALSASSVVVVGGGWIGSEVAASLRQLGRAVTLVSPTRAPLERILGPEVAEVYRRAHEDNGVELRAGARVTSVTGDGHVERVVTDDGSSIAADLVVVGIGAEPRTTLASEAGLAVESGILVDARLGSSVPAIYAAGDVANAWHPLYRRRIRIEHWDNAKRQGRAAGANMAGTPADYDRIPYFYSDQYDLGMEYTGYAPAWDEVVLRGTPESREFVAFWLQNGRVLAGMNMNVWDVAPAIERLIRSGATVDRQRLADPSQPLDGLAAAA